MLFGVCCSLFDCGLVGLAFYLCVRVFVWLLGCLFVCLCVVCCLLLLVANCMLPVVCLLLFVDC